MKLRELTEGFADGFKKGYGGSLEKRSTQKKAEPVISSASSPFDILSTDDAKDILRTVLSDSPLDYRQKSLLQKVYNKL